MNSPRSGYKDSAPPRSLGQSAEIAIGPPAKSTAIAIKADPALPRFLSQGPFKRSGVTPTRCGSRHPARGGLTTHLTTRRNLRLNELR